MEPLTLAFVGWFFTLFSALVLALGAAVVAWLYRSGRLSPRYLQGHVWNDVLLVAIWIAGLAGGMGVLAREPWSRFLLEMFCWVMIALVILSATTKLLALREARPNEPRAHWVSAISAALVVALPVVALCGATIVTLRSDVAWRAFTGG